MSSYTLIYKLFIFFSIICFMISFFMSGKSPVNALISGYSALTLSMCMVLVIILNNVLPTIQGKSAIEMIFSILIAIGPFFIILGVLAILLYLTIKYKNLIIDGHVSNNYYVFSNIIVILFLLQSYLLYKDMDTEKFNLTKKLSKMTSSLIYLIGLITFMSSMVLYTILTHFTTDG